MTSALDQKGLDAAENAQIQCDRNACDDELCNGFMCRNAIRAYLSTVTPAEIAGVVERLHTWGSPKKENARKLMREAATLIERLAASQAETRRQALEEAAKAVETETRSSAQRNAKDQWVEQIGQRAASSIRALIDQPSTEGGKNGE